MRSWLRLFLLLCASASLVFARVETPAREFDLQKFIDGALAAGKKEITVPPGRYRVVPSHGRHLSLKKLNNVTIIADGVELVCTQTTRALELEDCRNLTIRGLTIDYDPLPFTEGRITALAPDKSWIEFELFDGYPEKIGTQIELFDAKTERLKSLTHFGWTGLTQLDGRRYRVSKHAGYVSNAKDDREEVGDLVVANSEDAPGGWVAHAIMGTRCVNLRLEDVTLYASNCFSFFETDCDHSTYLRCRLIPRPLETDPVPRAHRRLRSGNLDAFHSKYALRGPQLIDCTARFQGDDCVNICGDYTFVAGSSGNTLRVLLHHPLNIAAGSPVELVSYTGTRLPDAKVLAITDAGEITEPERAFIAAQRMDRTLQSKLTAANTRAVTLTLDRPVDLPIGSVVASTERMGNGFLIQGCDFGFNRSRGILIKASHGKILGNTVTATWGPALLIAPEWWWLESGSADDLEIRANVLRDCRTTAIVVTARGGNGALAPAGAHQNLTLVENRITGSSLPAMSLSSTAGLRIDRNTFPAASDSPQKSIHLENCTDITGSNRL